MPTDSFMGKATIDARLAGVFKTVATTEPLA